jgi:hypothetical protein
MRTGTRFMIAIIALIVVMQVPMALALANTTPVSGRVTVSTQTGFSADVNFGASSQVALGSSQLFQSPSTINVSSQSNGHVVVESTNAGGVDIDQVTGSRTKLSGINTAQTTATINPSDKGAVELSGAVDAFEYQSSHAASDGSADFRLATSGSATIVVRDSGLSPNTNFELIGTNGEPVTGEVSVDSSGTATITVDGSESARDVKVLTKSEVAAPTLTNFTPSGAVSGPTVDFTVDVADDDLGSTSDSVEVTIDDGSSTLNTLTLTQPSTATASTTPSVGGTLTATATATDEFGETTTATTTVSVPDELVIRNRSAPNQLVNNTNANVTVEFIGQDSGQVFSRTTSTGRVDMTGLPVDEPSSSGPLQTTSQQIGSGLRVCCHRTQFTCNRRRRQRLTFGSGWKTTPGSSRPKQPSLPSSGSSSRTAQQSSNALLPMSSEQARAGRLSCSKTLASGSASKQQMAQPENWGP